MKKELICIRCPLGCLLCVSAEDGKEIVRGNSCPKGREYGLTEVTNPLRMVTGTMEVVGGCIPRVSVKTSIAIPKSLVLDVASIMRITQVKAPVNAGSVLMKNVSNSGADLIATRTVEKKDM